MCHVSLMPGQLHARRMISRPHMKVPMWLQLSTSCKRSFHASSGKRPANKHSLEYKLPNQPASADGEVAGAVAAVAGMDCLTPDDVRQHAKHIQAAPMILLDANLPAACLQVQASTMILCQVHFCLVQRSHQRTCPRHLQASQVPLHHCMEHVCPEQRLKVHIRKCRFSAAWPVFMKPFGFPHYE